MIKFIAILIAYFAIITSSFADECSGSWSIHFDSQKAQTRQEHSSSVWIPGVIELSAPLRQCVQSVQISPTQSNQLQLKGFGYTIEAQLFNEHFQALPRSERGFFASLNPNGITQIWVRMANAEFAPAGNYYAQLNAIIANKQQETDDRLVDLNYHMPPNVSVRIPTVSEPWLSQSGNNYRVDMGEMTHGSQRNISLEVKSNANASITIESQNGKLMHDNISNAFIDYQLELQGQRWNPRRRFHSALPNVYSNRYTPIPFSIKVAPQPKAYAGHYSDRLTITVTAQ
ncbi:hypothetical protein [Vibrio maerlii]|uniref:hypothetical protein n=1 Tax=Vibrio maerlii TaxID=2231648 RepID=UPI000E3CC4E2|nr:hypothetical protein [Vibrio maerlii]